MGGSTYSRDDYAVRSSLRSSGVRPKAFAYSAAVHSGAVPKKVHASLSPKGVGMRESRDSAEHPVTLPIGLFLDTTGSMGEVPLMIEKELNKLMGALLEDKASGKKYLGEAYPAILVGAVDDYRAMRGEGTLQVGQFESGIEIDDNLENLWITGNGGGTYEEQYDLGLYFFARHTVHDHWEKRKKRGYIFIIGDEHAYDVTPAEAIREVIGDKVQGNIPFKTILAEVMERYNVFFILPNMTHHYNDDTLVKYWQKLLGQQNIIRLEDPHKICECIVAAIAISEEHAGLDDLLLDGVVSEDMKKSLVPLSKATGEISKHSTAGLPGVSGTASGTERL